MKMRGYFSIGIYNPIHEVNVGTLWRSAYQLGAAYIFTIGAKYRQQASDTGKAHRHIPLFHYETIDDLQIPRNCTLIGIEFPGQQLSAFSHPERAIYLLGAEDHGLPEEIKNRCDTIVSIESIRQPSYNVAVAGSIVMHNRLSGKLKARI